MGWASKLGWLVIIILIILALMYFLDKPMFCNIFASVMNPNISSKICGSQIYTNNYNSTIMKEQHNFTNKEISAIENSHLPFQINPANTLVFGSFKNTSVRICGQEQAYFEILNPSQLNVLYDGYYVPIYQIVKAYGNYNPNLIGQKVYLNFITNNYENISAPYIVKSENIKNNVEYWNFTFDGNTSNAINSMLNTTTGNLTISWLNGIILLNGTPIISPKNPYIDNGNFIVPNC